MIEELARVVRVDGEFVWVEIRRTSACGGCAAKAGCGTAVFGRFLGARRVRLRALGASAITVGDGVVIGIRERALVRGSLALYAVPLLGLLAGAAAGQDLAQRLLISDSELVSIAAGFLGLAGGFAWVWHFTRRVADDADYQPVILRRMAPADELATGSMNTGLDH
jgi:sigma-E factor negative regulatory protein RseC